MSCAPFSMEAYTDIGPSTSQPALDLPSTLDQVDTIFSTFAQVAILHFDLRPSRDHNLRPSTNSPLIDHVEPLSLTLMSVTFMRNVYVRFVLALIPLSHYSRNAPRIHNVGHFFQIAKVPSGVCKSRPAFVLDSVTFVAIAKCSQTQ